MLDVPCWPPRIHPYLPHCVLCPMLTCVSGSLAPSHPHLALVLPREKTAVDQEDGAPAIGVATGCTTLGDVFTHCPPLRTIRTLTDPGAAAGGWGSDARSRGAEISKQSPRHHFWDGGGVSCESSTKVLCQATLMNHQIHRLVFSGLFSHPGAAVPLRQLPLEL